MITFQPKKLPGRWRDGYALDLRTISSTYLGDDEFGHARFETIRSEAGELLDKLKFAGEQTVIPAIADALEKFLRDWCPGVEVIVPVPPSSERTLQPVMVLAEELGRRLGIATIRCIKKIRDTPQLKNVADFDERLRLLDGLHEVDPSEIRGKKILLFDDLYRSGATMNAITDILYDQGGTAEVFALTVTRTRSNR
jgi:competence protein ComFC